MLDPLAGGAQTIENRWTVLLWSPDEPDNRLWGTLIVPDGKSQAPQRARGSMVSAPDNVDRSLSGPSDDSDVTQSALLPGFPTQPPGSKFFQGMISVHAHHHQRPSFTPPKR